MSSEKLPFILPAVFTIDSEISKEQRTTATRHRCWPAAALRAKLPCTRALDPRGRELARQGVTQDETHALAASIKMEEIFQDTESFKQAVFNSVQLEVNQFGPTPSSAATCPARNTSRTSARRRSSSIASDKGPSISLRSLQQGLQQGVIKEGWTGPVALPCGGGGGGGDGGRLLLGAGVGSRERQPEPVAAVRGGAGYRVGALQDPAAGAEPAELNRMRSD
ncbi:hypothetical protein C2845_PM01G10060 [Panicum miliaceum]|uniref:Flotillin-like n=1 Tax=Panicum miliaceum TaxID=4540 RepID=A0A3L6TH08_PANMI|nr:hypothetical protein C2845_PM01G10060 [Panicum miliaceum]